jgi:hypothetical protein|tara:strand:+ start:297 stop:872 length:576 start_codon:yes stop_codon:yes gene_type:complete
MSDLHSIKKKNTEHEKESPVVGKKLELRKKMGTVTLVTPPSFFQNQNKSFCLINLSKRDKDAFADAINKHMPKEDITLYLWDDNNFSSLDPFGVDDDVEYEKYLENWKPNKKGRDYTWLLNACRSSTVVVMNMDYSSNQLKVWSGYILTLAKTYFVNSNADDAYSFTVLNRNKINGMHELFSRIKKNMDSK